MKIFKKIILTILVLISVAAIPVKAAGKVYSADDLNLQIKSVEKRLKNSIDALRAINPEMLDIILTKPWTTASNIAIRYFLDFYKKEFFEYLDAVGDLEALNELRFYADMNALSNQPKDSIKK